MADGECADTHKGQRIGEIGQADFEHFEEALDQEHDNAPFDLRSFFLLNDLSERFLEEHGQSRQRDQNSEERCRRDRMAAEYQDDHDYDKAVEDDSCK